MILSTRRVFLLLLFVTCLLGPAQCHEAASNHFGQALALPPREAQESGERKHELAFKLINFLLLVGVLGYLLRKPLSEFFLQRSASIRKGLEAGRKALEASQAQFREVEQRLARLGEEIRAFRESAAREMQAERESLRQATREEAKKILDSARAQMETAGQASILELKKYAAQEALRLAEELLRERLDDSSRKRLVSRFVEQLPAGS